jgi:hypothetical protein
MNQFHAVLAEPDNKIVVCETAFDAGRRRGGRRPIAAECIPRQTPLSGLIFRLDGLAASVLPFMILLKLERHPPNCIVYFL